MTALQDAAARLAAGDSAGALAQAGAELATLDGLADVNAVACLVVIGRCHQALAGPRAARAAFEQAYDTALAVDEPLLAAVALGALASQDRIDGCYDHAAHRGEAAIDKAVRDAGESDLLAATLRNELGITYKHLARFDEAEDLYRESLASLQGTLGADHSEVAAVLHNLAGLAHARGDYRTAERLGRQGLAIRVTALGDDHLAVATDRAALAPILDGLDRQDEAEKLLRQALATFERVLGGDHYEVAVARHNLAAIDHRRGRLDRAAAGYRRSLHIRATVLGDDHPELATTLVNLGVLEREQGHLPAATTALRRAIALLEPTVPSDHPALVTARHEWEELAREPSESTARLA